MGRKSREKKARKKRKGSIQIGVDGVEVTLPTPRSPGEAEYQGTLALLSLNGFLCAQGALELAQREQHWRECLDCGSEEFALMETSILMMPIINGDGDPVGPPLQERSVLYLDAVHPDAAPKWEEAWSQARNPSDAFIKFNPYTNRIYYLSTLAVTSNGEKVAPEHFQAEVTRLMKKSLYPQDGIIKGLVISSPGLTIEPRQIRKIAEGHVIQ